MSATLEKSKDPEMVGGSKGYIYRELQELIRYRNDLILSTHGKDRITLRKVNAVLRDRKEEVKEYEEVSKLWETFHGLYSELKRLEKEEGRVPYRLLDEIENIVGEIEKRIRENIDGGMRDNLNLLRDKCVNR